MKRRDALLGLGAGAAWMVMGGSAFAQHEFPPPGITIRYVVPFEPGGLTDIMARIAGQRLAENWKVNVVIENRGGGNAQIGAAHVARSPVIDGSQILAITQSHAVNVTLFPDAPFSLTRDLRPVALLADSPMLVVVPVASTLRDFRQLMAESRARSLTASSAGVGTGPHLTLELFNQLNGSRIVHVPYKGGAPSMTDLVGGHVDVSFANYPAALPFVKSGNLRPLAICSQARHPDLPDVPTAHEAGLPGLVVENWTGVMANAKTPDAIVEKYSRELVKIMKTPDIAGKAEQNGYRVNAMDSEEFGRHLKAEIERWGRVVTKAGIKA
jgi:tripartite-type tricarboxylate transporter receptor subunit TctC